MFYEEGEEGKCKKRVKIIFPIWLVCKKLQNHLSLKNFNINSHQIVLR